MTLLLNNFEIKISIGPTRGLHLKQWYRNLHPHEICISWARSVFDYILTGDIESLSQIVNLYENDKVTINIYFNKLKKKIKENGIIKVSEQKNGDFIIWYVKEKNNISIDNYEVLGILRYSKNLGSDLTFLSIKYFEINLMTAKEINSRTCGKIGKRLCKLVIKSRKNMFYRLPFNLRKLRGVGNQKTVIFSRFFYIGINGKKKLMKSSINNYYYHVMPFKDRIKDIHDCLKESLDNTLNSNIYNHLDIFNCDYKYARFYINKITFIYSEINNNSHNNFLKLKKFFDSIDIL